MINSISSSALTIMRAYEFPGNARELANIIERAVIVANGKRLEVENLPVSVKMSQKSNRSNRPLTLAQVEARYVAETLVATGGNKSECARILGISRKNLYEKIARYKLTD